MECCSQCEGNGLVDRMFLIEKNMTTLRRYERIRCPQCEGTGVIIAGK